MSLIIKNIKGLVQVCDQEFPGKRKGIQMQELPVVEEAWIFIRNEHIVDFGRMCDFPMTLHADEEIDATGRFVLPAWIDCHTHLVFPESRENEFVMKINGATYEEIAAAGGGILNSAGKLKETTHEALLESALFRLDEVIRMGTGAIEIKSGYGLSLEGEIKILRVIRELKKISPIPVKATFLGAHAIPSEFRGNKDAYLQVIVNEMLPEIQKEHLADYIDIFIEKGFYSIEDAQFVIEAGIKAGLKPRIHVDQLSEIGGVPLGVRYSAVSVDHLENISVNGIAALKESDTMPVLLPGCSFYLSMKYPPAREMINAGLPLVLASDYNPGSCPSGNMNFVLSLACIKMKMLPSEAINAATVNAAYALEVQHKAGVIRKNIPANLMITRPITSLSFIPYSFGNHVVEQMVVNGNIYQGINKF